MTVIGGLTALLAIAAAAGPSAARASEPTDYAGVRETLRREIPKELRASHTAGLSIALVDGERTVWSRGFGWADRAARVPVADDTLFHIGSTSKTLSAAAVMQLVEQGRVDLDAPLSTYVPRFKMLPRFPGSVVTVRSVLDMHSGIPGDFMNGLITAGQPYPEFRLRLLRTLAKTYPERPVNTTWAYSNSGYILLQNLVENVTGQDFESYTSQHLFGPMGMVRSTFDDTAPPDSELSRGYQAVAGTDGKVQMLPQPREYVNGWATGSVVSSSDEMAEYLKTLIAGGVAPGGDRILDESTLRQMTTPQTHLPLDITSFRAGLGWWIGDSGNKWMGRAIYWNGDTANFHTFFRWLPELGLGVYVSVNTSSPVQVQEEVGLRALGLMVTAKSGRTAPAPPRPAPVADAPSSRKLRRAAGLYASSSGLTSVTVAGNGLRIRRVPPSPGVSPAKMLPRADGWYAGRSLPPGNPFSSAWIKPATVDGRRLLLTHIDRIQGPEPNGVVTVLGEKIPSDYRIPRVWRSRTGSYRATNVVPASVESESPRTGELRIVRGVLEWNGLVVNPEGPGLAFTYGLSPWLLGRGEGSALSSSGKRLTYLGVRYRKVKTR